MLSKIKIVFTLLISSYLTYSQNLDVNNDLLILPTDSLAAVQHENINNSEIFLGNISDFKIIYHTVPVHQQFDKVANIYPVIAFIESEVYRINNKRIKLSEHFVIYNYFLENTLNFLNDSQFTVIHENDHYNILEIINKYGLIPHHEYPGNNITKEQFRSLMKDYNDYLDFTIDSDIRNQELIINKVKSILDFYLGEPPAYFAYKGEIYNPGRFLNNFLNIRTGDYFSFISNMVYDYNGKGKIAPSDRLYHYNLSLGDFADIFHNAATSGFPILICPDKKYQAYDYKSGIAKVLPSDMPTGDIDRYTRHFRLLKDDIINNKTYTYANVIGYNDEKGKMSYLVADQDKRAFQNLPAGYLIYDENYIKLKVLYFVVHVDAVRDILDKIIK